VRKALFLCIHVENRQVVFAAHRILCSILVSGYCKNLSRIKAPVGYIQSRCLPSIAPRSLKKRTRRCDAFGRFVQGCDTGSCWARTSWLLVRLWRHAKQYNHDFQPGHTTDPNSYSGPYPNPYSHADTYSNTQPYSYSNAYAHPYSNACSGGARTGGIGA
jgi:hypothetical protein